MDITLSLCVHPSVLYVSPDIAHNEFYSNTSPQFAEIKALAGIDFVT